MSQSMFRQLSSVNGPIQILGDPAMKVPEAQGGVKYTDQTYDIAEEINVGIGGRFEVPAAAGPLISTVRALPAPNIALPFMTQRATIPSSVALYFLISVAKIAAVDLIDGDPICADIFSEVSLNNGVRWPTANTGQNIKLVVDNTDTGSAHEPRMSLTGVRLR